MEAYLRPSKYINWDDPSVLAKAKALARSCATTEEIAHRCFLFVRDQIKHSWDYQLNPVTCRASDVLEHGTGYCYAKSHLLAALLRANQIPAGLCYQRLAVESEGPPYCLHGLNAIFLADHGWYRVDPRGNKADVDAQFTPPVERLAFLADGEGEAGLPEIWPEPLPVVVQALEAHSNYLDVANNLPDIEIVGGSEPANGCDAANQR